MRRRDFIAFAGGAAATWSATWPLGAWAQQAGKIPRIGVLSSSRDNPLIGSSYPAFLAELGKLGFTGGENLIEYRRIDEGAAKAFAAAAELARSNVDAMVAIGPEIAPKAAVAASATIPIVMIAINFDPVAGGYVRDIARPDKNITGLVALAPELASKQIELLVEGFPDDTPIAALGNRLRPSSLTPPNAPPSPCTLNCVPIRSKIRRLISTRRSEVSRGMARVWCWSYRGRHSPRNAPISPIWRYSTACRRCSPSNIMSRPAG